MDQLQDAKTRISNAQTESEQAKLKISHLEKQIKTDEPRAKKARDQNMSALKELESHRIEGTRLENELQNLDWNEDTEQANLSRKAELQAMINELHEAPFFHQNLRQILTLCIRIQRQTSIGVKSKVSLLSYSLWIRKSSKLLLLLKYVQVVVVENEVIGTQLLEKGKLRKRVTIIPLNRISAFRASAEKIDSAHQLAPGKVDLALSLVGYDSEVSAAMEYVFGSTLICADADTAKTVTFNPSVRLKSVTLEGDVYDPSGTLSGGSSVSTSGLLVHLQKLNKVTREINIYKREFDAIERQMNMDQEKNTEAKTLKKQLDLKRHELRLTEEQINSNSHSKAFEDMKKRIGELKLVMIEAKNKGDDASKDVRKIEKDMNEFKNNKDGKLKELQKELDDLKASILKQSTNVKDCKREFQTIQLEAEQLGADLGAAQEQLDDANSTLQIQQSELQSLHKDHSKIKDQYDFINAEMESERAKMISFDDELKSLEEASRQKNSEITESGLELQKLRHEVEKFHKELQGVESLLVQMEREHEWIGDEKSNFGRQGTPYYFANQNISECKNNLKSLTERFKGLQKKVNAKVMNMIDSVEKKESSLKTMLKTVRRDKRKIEETISTLDEYKKEALQRTWEKVNGDFGQIFAELLPGNFAKLEAPEGKNISDGLEVRVCLGKVWKQSLTELSGGQRSLIALALIMSLLQFKPAPMYILDEVDAALDLSHTQNIGRLIKTRFKGSQFIVVSLKEGMFSNANRIYRTRFMDGTSVVMQ
ncbi:Structural maintenance of chromosomes protein 2 [Neolecta irregularis DAH-3]|uniref:Structural maintenance of chromosomes protein 2 n=1 Tax=Neolecta irregularis (strain DAH-3) TaxID=1198029 RepID=A0A1U7LSA9_NEOID|nr:Structural maintenance of chromosomes protein 2 [Neolecta irregularis DAH-3]|eukprot:OLL25555.1 Structural maintenance of chromosomes protein 2 [Neolecta irregularis DAH-3]